MQPPRADAAPADDALAGRRAFERERDVGLARGLHQRLARDRERCARVFLVAGVDDGDVDVAQCVRGARSARTASSAIRLPPFMSAGAAAVAAVAFAAERLALQHRVEVPDQQQAGRSVAPGVRRDEVAAALASPAGKSTQRVSKPSARYSRA